MFDWLIAALLLAIMVYLIAPQQLPVSLYKLSLVALAAVAGYWIDRSTFPYARPHDMSHCGDPMVVAAECYAAYCVQAGGVTFDNKALPTFEQLGAERQKCWLAASNSAWKQWVIIDKNDGLNFAAAMLRRAIIIAAAMIAMGLGA